MKSRIVGSLSEFIKEEPNSKAFQLMQALAQETDLSTLAIKTKSQQIIKHIIHNYAAFDISTIDKFTYKVIRAFANDLNLPINFEVTLETDALLIEAVDTIIAKAGEEELLTKLLVDFTMEKTDNDKSWDISREIIEVAKLINNENNREELAQLHDKSINDFIGIKNKLYNSCQSLESENKNLASQMLALIEKNGIDLKSFSGSYFPNHLKSIVEGKYNPQNKKYYEFGDIKINKTAKDTLLIESIIPDLLQGICVIYKNFEKRDFYHAFLKNITPLSLLNEISEKLKHIQEEKSTLSISEFNAIIHREIQNQPAPFIYERLGERYRHFFIDEFQDTSEMQWQNLIPLIDNALSGQDESGQKGTLMIVGDPKQSIYRWRGGKAEQFISLNKGENPFNNPDKKLFHLEKNYRSYSQIIDFNNNFFKLIAAEFDNLDYRELYQNQSNQKTNEKTGGYVNVKFLSQIKNDEAIDTEDLNISEKYCDATFETIKKVIQQGFNYKDIAILTRKRDQGVLIANFLTKQNIPLLSSETLMLKNASEVQFIIWTLKYLKNSFDAEAKAYFLFYLAQNRQKELPVPDFIANGIEKELEPDFEAWLKKFDISINFNNIRKKSLYEAVEVIIATFIFPKQDNAYIQYFLDLVLERDINKQAGISDFLFYWDKSVDKFSIPSPEGNNAVRIMTIHKSKGLEFPVVILPFAEEDYERKPKDKLWLEADETDFGLPKVLVDNNRAIEGFGAIAAEVYKQKKEEELLDNINVLYVALTRAEEQLYVISQIIKPRKDGIYPYNMTDFFIKYLIHRGAFNEDKNEYEFGSPTKLSIKNNETTITKQIKNVSDIFNPQNIKIAQRESLMWGTHQQKAIEYGNIIHEILSFVHSKSDVDIAIIKAIENGLINSNQKESVYSTINEIINHEELKLFFEEGNIVLNEKTIIQKEDKTIKPDRMVMTQNNEVYLLDYKTGMHQTKYQLQLENYQKAIEKMNLKVMKKALVYIGEQIEVIHL
jgi:ATP-dependent exoDNAse (exonuclease V) beta subunit